MGAAAFMQHIPDRGALGLLSREVTATPVPSPNRRMLVLIALQATITRGIGCARASTSLLPRRRQPAALDPSPFNLHPRRTAAAPGAPRLPRISWVSADRSTFWRWSPEFAWSSADDRRRNDRVTSEQPGLSCVVALPFDLEHFEVHVPGLPGASYLRALGPTGRSSG